MFVYHTTTRDALVSIMRDGKLIPQKSRGAGINYNDPTAEELNDYVGYVFVSTTFKRAEKYIAAFGEDWKIILEFEIDSGLLLPDKSDCYECTTWEESHEKMGQACIKGELSLKHLTNVYIIWT